ncbi:hypothetical protein K1720_06950 [Thermococcus argininiproducens]|uniref:Uncharacterized protein n=1 Tax=Thermococcus argininiproducens TaxID=2866384 RepID=A0A9E7SCL4_9EURY|nr:hypothetical protein [Thermococcus argininiproducens]USG99277.1 hypothetical protein K1720_06950 [Thermococcus argininiproducens]
MLARIVYYRLNSIPEEEIIAANKIEKAIEMAEKKLRNDIVEFEIEII